LAPVIVAQDQLGFLIGLVPTHLAMKFTAITTLALLCNVLPSLADNEGDRTITKVVKLLQEMLDKSQEDGDKDRDLYAKFKCYCDDNEADKTEAISEYKKEIKLLSNDIKELQASSGELSTQCAQLKQDMADNEAAREEAVSVREKANEDFVAEEKDMVGAIDSMDQAIETLAAVGADQTQSSGADHEKFMGKKSLLKLKSSMKEAMSAVSVLLTHKQRRSLESFIQAPFTGTYTAQSGEIVGILKSMRDTFKQNLASARSAEKAAAEAHEKFMKIKKEEFSTMSEAYEEKQAKLGGNDEELASKRETLADVEADLANDEEFLAKLIVMCAEKAKQFEERKLLRANEEAAISQAIAILNSDAAFESFGKTKATKDGATSFVQVSQHHRHVSTRQAVTELMQRTAKAQKSLKIARIAALLQADNPFTTVLEEIEKMMKLIDAEQKADEEQKEWCETEREENHKKKTEKETKIEDLKNEITELVDAIDNPETGLKAMIQQTENDLTTNHDNQVSETLARSGENMAYQKNIKNIVEVQDILKKAVKVLKKYYAQFDEKEEAELLQEEPAPPTTWEGEEGESKGYAGQRGAGGEVLGMLDFIIKESGTEEETAHKDEEESQTAYEDSMQTLKDEQAKFEKSLAELQETLAEKEKTLFETRENLMVTEKELKAVERYLLKIKPGCDYIAENFDKRSENRKKESGSLEEAVTMLKGTPAYKAAVNAAEQEALGDCKAICNEEGQDHAKCKACLAGVSVPGFCAGHKEDAVAGC